MPNRDRFQITGTEQKLGRGPVGSPSANPPSGQWQLTGDAQRMGRKPIQSTSANPPSGQWQIMGDGAKLSRTPVKGWGNAYPLVMSERATEQSKTAAGGGSRKRKG